MNIIMSATMFHWQFYLSSQNDATIYKNCET